MSTRVAILFGGRSVEKEVSLNSGRHIYNIIDKSRFEPIPIFLDSGMHMWILPLPLIVQNTTKDIESRLSEAKRITYEQLKNIADVIFPITFGKYGEDGCLQGLLTLLGIPFVGSQVAGAALGQDKAMQRVVMSQNPKINLPPYTVIDLSRHPELDSGSIDSGSMAGMTTEKLIPQFPFPLVLKPTREGSTIGVEFVENMEQWSPALERISKFDSRILVEPYIEGLEFSCVVIGNMNSRALTPTETVHSDKIFTYNEKYMPGASNKITPARVTKEKIKEIQDMCVETYKTLNFRGYARIDGFVLSKELGITNQESERKPEGSQCTSYQLPVTSYSIGSVLITDPNAFSGMAPSSWTFHQAAHEGWTPTQFLSTLIDFAMEK